MQRNQQLYVGSIVAVAFVFAAALAVRAELSAPEFLLMFGVGIFLVGYPLVTLVLIVAGLFTKRKS